MSDNWTGADNAKAYKEEGWFLWDTTENGVVTWGIDYDHDKFKSAAEARKFVEAKADAGSAWHERALTELTARNLIGLPWQEPEEEKK